MFEVVSPRGRRAVPYGEQQPYDEQHIVCRGTYDDVLQQFEENLWSDGLPIVPPTLERVTAMVAHCAGDPLEVLGVVGHESIEVTPWAVAVNAVMAGCRPEDFPIVTAVSRLMLSPGFRARDAGSTTGWEVLVVLSGGELSARGFNAGTGVMRVGCRATSSLGRFTRLWLRNLASLLTPPGLTDMAAIGQTFLVAMVEDESVQRLGWPTCREEWGYDADHIAVAVQGTISVSPPIYTAGGKAASHLEMLARGIAAATGPMLGIAAEFGTWRPLLALNPAIADVFAREGMTKDDLRHELAAAARVPAQWVNDGLFGVGRPHLSVEGLVESGRLPKAFHESDAPDRLVPAIPHPDDLAIVVTGNPGRNQSKYYVPLGVGCRLTCSIPSAIPGPAQ